MNEDAKCPCGSALDLEDCCGKYISGKETAPTAEALMRSRYVAYVQNNGEYLLETWHKTTRPEKADFFDPNVVWKGLEIISTQNGLENDTDGVVEFRAKCRIKEQAAGVDESSSFVKEDDRWYYVDGKSIQPIRSRKDKINRNAPCPCGSGKKYKRCCGNK